MVAVERANGGELAPLLQVLWTLNSFTAPHSRPTPAAFAASTTVLIEIGVVEYVDNQLGLTPEGRKLLRRSGMPNDPRHVALVTELLQQHGEDHPGHHEPASVPTEEDVRQAMSDGDRIQETGSGAGTPIIGEDTPFYSTILGLGMPGIVVGLAGCRPSRPKTPAPSWSRPSPYR